MSELHAAPKHRYHLVDPSPWPLIGAIAAGFLTTGAVLFMHGYGWTVLIIGILAVLGTMAVWWRDVIREATFQGYHTPVVQLGLRYGMALFIASERSSPRACFRSAAFGHPRPSTRSTRSNSRFSTP
jgi:cytochrome c oxidase subunit III